MKFAYHPIMALLLCMSSLFLYSYEFFPLNPVAQIELSNNYSPNTSHSLSGLSSRAKYLSRMIQRNVPHNAHNSIRLPEIDANQSPARHFLSSSIKFQRDKIPERFMENNAETHKNTFKKYHISSLSKKYLTFNNIKVSSLESCQGNTLQQVIHQEFLVLTDATAHLWNQQFCSQEIKDITAVIGDFIDAGVSFNRTNEIKKACALADAVWALFDCVVAVSEGAIDGVSAVLHDVTHPIQTVQNLTAAVISCSYYLGIALQEIDCITRSLVSGNFDIAHNKYTQWQEHFKHIAYTLNEYSQNITVRDTIKTITSSLVQCYATTRAITGFSTLFKNAHHSAISIAKKVSEGVQESTLLMSCEGIPLRIAQETVKQITKIPSKKAPCSRDKLSRVISTYKNQKIQVGNVTCLLDKNGLKHILERHHPLYWNGTIAPKAQTFFNKNISIDEIIDIIKQVVQQNKQLITKEGIMNGQIDGIIKNVRYRVGFQNGRIGQFYIPTIQ